MYIVPILVALAAVYKLLARKIMDTSRRMNGAEFAFCVFALFPLIVAISYDIWQAWVSFRAGIGMLPYPAIAYDLYSDEELALSPVIVTLCIYAGIVYLLRLKWWPEHLSEEEIREWQRVRIVRSLWFSVPLLILDLSYVAYKWYPVWGQWFGLIQGVSA